MAIIFFASVSTSTAQQRYAYTHKQMGTAFRIVFFAEIDSSAAKKIAQGLCDYIDTLNKIYSDYIPNSDLSLLSDQAGTGQKTKVRPELFDILQASKRYSEASGGAFDVSVGALTRLWRKARHLKEPPDSASVRKALATVGHQHIKLYKRGQKVQLKKAGTRLDLGGIAQGYAADKCLAMLHTQGIERALVDAGGDIALGAAPPGQPGWAIQRPVRTPDGITTYETLLLSNCGITTSGATFRYLEANGVRYSHIVDPRTGWGLTHGRLVTVHAATATDADAWATAISVSGTYPKPLGGKKGKLLGVWVTTVE
jgi:FAD:protein FMN transferase